MKNADFAFIVHSRDRSDMLRKFPALKLMPKFFFDKLTMALPPFVVSHISGLTTSAGKEATGLVIGVPMTAQQLLENREKAGKKILQAVRLGKSKGASFVGLGAMTASLTRGGKDVMESISDVYVTTGRTYTIKNIVEYVEYCVELFALNREKITVGVVGAVGGIGSGTTIALAQKGFKRFMLIDVERKIPHLHGHLERLNNLFPDLKINVSHKVESIKDCTIVVGATSAADVVIHPHHVTPGTIIINDAQPSDVSPEVLKTRNDVLVIEGGVLHAPGIDCHFNFGLMDKHNIFSCLAETLVLAHRNQKEHSSIGEFDLSFFKSIDDHGKKLGFKISKLQNEHGYVKDDFLSKFATIIASRNTDN